MWADLKNQNKRFWFVDKKKHKDVVAITVKLACDKDIVAGEYSKRFSEYDQPAYQERQQSLVILITKAKSL